ncbi:MAG: hypothetical protein ACI8YQ_004076 [Polaribacter sp.]|jgi:hypothetical protein
MHGDLPICLSFLSVKAAIISSHRKNQEIKLNFIPFFLSILQKEYIFATLFQKHPEES